jgi:hypothetical protein
VNAPSQRTLLPHEHGAYGQLIMPLLTALAIGRPGVSSLALAAAAILGFIAHEPLLVVVGQRGLRAREQDRGRARRLLVLLGALTLACGALGLALAPAAARWAALFPLLLAAGVALLVVKKLEKTAAGEIVVAMALSSAGLAVALAGGAPLSWAVAAWITWILAFAAATLAVQVVLVRARSRGERDPGPLAAVTTIAIVALAFSLAARAALPWAAPLALAPVAGMSLALSLFRISPRRLREIGWAMVGASVLTMLLLVVGLRA